MKAWPLVDALHTTAEASGSKPASVHPKPVVIEDAHGKSLHFTLAELQSRMRTSRPWHLEVDYTRTMMGFLLAQPRPARLGLVGLGGGSLVKFCHRELPGSHMTVVEINPHVIALRQEFAVPDDDDRLRVIQGDGAAFLAAQDKQFDVLMVDGFDQHGQPEGLCSQDFYDDCLQALGPDGVLAVNLHYDDAGYPVWLARLQRSFAGNAVEIPAPEKSNCIVFARRGALLSPRNMSLQLSLSLLSAEARNQLKAEFARILWTMKDLECGL